MPLERLPKQALLAKSNGKIPVGPLITRWINYIEDLGCNLLGLHPRKIMKEMEDREVRPLNIELLPPQTSQKSGQRREKERGFRFSRKNTTMIKWYFPTKPKVSENKFWYFMTKIMHYKY